MSHFEYISVAVSLVYSLILAKLLGALPAAIRRDRRYWLHLLWILNLILATVASWWRIWLYRETEWDPIAFFALLAIPSIIYLRASVLVSDAPREIYSWRAHYYGSRRPFFLLQVVGGINFIAAPLVISGELLPTESILGTSSVAILAIVAAYSTSPRLHAALAVAMFLGFASFPFLLPYE